MTRADSVLSTPPTSTSAIQGANPPLETRTERVDSLSLQPDIELRESGNLASESRGPAERLSRRFVLAGVALAAALPIAATVPAVAARVPDAELIDLGVRFEALVDRYYATHRRWSRSLAAAHAEHDREFGNPADRNYEHPPEIAAAFIDSCERSGAREADDALSAICDEMRPIEVAINAASVSSIEGLRAKALVAFREVSPLSCGGTEFSFDDAYPFQQLFTAVAEVCGLKNKMAATGYELPDIGMGDEMDEGEEA